jgi:hypothetical protein
LDSDSSLVATFAKESVVACWLRFSQIWLEGEYENKKIRHRSIFLATHVNRVKKSDDFGRIIWLLKISKST